MLHADLHHRLKESGELTLELRVRPGASKNSFGEMLADGTFKISVKASPQEGKANEELVRFLAETFDVPPRNVRVLSGQSSRKKMVRIVAR